MASVRLERVGKTYPNGHVAARDLNLEIANGEFMVLVGPSGCGKSTALRMVAGLETPTAGRILIGDKDVTALPPQQRDIAMVFQSYALYPHMTVRENLGFGLRMRGTDANVSARRVDEAARALALEQVLDRKPAQLSGGQRQRVALGRAIVREPKVFLFDEPLSNLDAKLRVETRAELARMHRRLGATVVYVTHDQEEAMTLGSRVTVMRDGVIQQVGPPMELYRRPANQFVAGFVGSPAMNFLPRAEVPASLSPREATLGVRPHDITIVAQGAGDENAYVELIESRGSEKLIYLCLRGNNQGPAIRIVAPPETPVETERTVGVRFDREKLHWFDPDSGNRLSP
jgi:multiple sugar transport system ATP-binding protein